MESIDALIAGITDEATKAAVLAVVQQLKEHQDQEHQDHSEFCWIMGLCIKSRQQFKWARKVHKWKFYNCR